VHPEVVAVMREIGVDLAYARPQRLTDAIASRCDMLVTMGCGEACPVVPGVRREDWPLADPKGRTPEDVRAIRDAIDERVAALVSAERWGRAAPTPQ
jgi:arsenate reductase